MIFIFFHPGPFQKLVFQKKCWMKKRKTTKHNKPVGNLPRVEVRVVEHLVVLLCRL